MNVRFGKMFVQAFNSLRSGFPVLKSGLLSRLLLFTIGMFEKTANWKEMPPCLKSYK